MTTRALLSLMLALPLALAGCIGTDDGDLAEQSLTGDVAGVATGAVSVHRAGQAVPDLPGGVEDLPRFVERLIPDLPGAEPNIGVTSSGAYFVTAFDHVVRSTDQGRTWESVHEFGPAVGPSGTPLGEIAEDPVFTSDPMLWVDPLTDRVFVPQMFPILACSQAIWSDDDGESWFEKPLSCGTPVVDHQKLATGPYVDGNPLADNPVYPNAVYYCYNKLVATNCAVSYDGGINYAYEAVVATGDQCGGINGHPAAAPDGTVFVPLGLGCGVPTVAVSTDNGRTWTLKQFAHDLGHTTIDPDMTVTADGTAYYVWHDESYTMRMVRSSDNFETVEGPFQVSPPQLTTTIFTAVTSGADGNIAVAYVGTDDTDEAPTDAPEDTRWHFYVTTSFDADSNEPTFITHQVTPEEDPVQIGYIWEGGGGDPGRNLLDFIDMHLDPSTGQPVATFTDGCVEGCAFNDAATQDDSRSRVVAVAVLGDGPGLGIPGSA